MISKPSCLITRFPAPNYDKQMTKNYLHNSITTVRHHIYFANKNKNRVWDPYITSWISARKKSTTDCDSHYIKLQIKRCLKYHQQPRTADLDTLAKNLYFCTNQLRCRFRYKSRGVLKEKSVENIDNFEKNHSSTFI